MKGIRLILLISVLLSLPALSGCSIVERVFTEGGGDSRTDGIFTELNLAIREADINKVPVQDGADTIGGRG
ncbi:hypothetical protein SAMN04488688_104403 [Paenibacillus sp. cl141a]|uniref:hypothetical protein n=1 Tax=Paenibacillus sp. cl141a TaxID=1761877 RepID=UPI0008B40D63|nr:hypothetical protein [Paenibacillus sp. cl141a]SEL55647.1 hypothetical protein SAMN04488688_104403 [Paenibacillus sp. cl141a]